MLKTNPLVSIIVPTFNREYLIGETLDSVLVQTYTNWECIVVDDGSTDETEKIIKTYVDSDSRFQCHKRPKTRLKGANACRNYGFEMSKGDYLIFLDSDDLLENTCLEKRCLALNLKRNIGKSVFVFNMGLLINKVKTKRVYNKDFNNSKIYLKQFLKGVVPWTITCVFWDRETFEDVGKFDEKFQRLQDVDLHTRLLLNDVEIHRVPQVDTWYRILDDISDYVSEDKLPRIINSYVRYINKFYNYSLKSNVLISNEEMNYFLRINYINVLKKYVFKDSLVGFKQMMELNKQQNILDRKQQFMFRCLALYHILGLNNSKGLGYYKLRRQCFK